MRVRFNQNVPALLCGALLIVVGSGWAIDAQGPSPAARQTVPSSPTVKKPLLGMTRTHDRRSIQGTTLSRDGEWLADALTAGGGRRRARRPQPRAGNGGTSTHAGPNPNVHRRTGTSSPSRLRKPRRTRNAIGLAAQRNSQSQGRGQGENEGQSQSQRNQPKTGRGDHGACDGAGLMSSAWAASASRKSLHHGRDASRQWRRGPGRSRRARGRRPRGASTGW